MAGAAWNVRNVTARENSNVKLARERALLHAHHVMAIILTDAYGVMAQEKKDVALVMAMESLIAMTIQAVHTEI